MSLSIALITIVCLTMASAVIHELTDDNFDESIADGSTWLVMFFAPWDVYSRPLVPILEQLSKEDIPATIASVDCTVHRGIYEAQEISSYPTLKLFSNGSSKGKEYLGMRSLDALKAYITSKDEL